MMRRNERGEGWFGTIVAILVLGAIVLVSVKIIPLKIKDAELVDYMTEQSKFASRQPVERLEKSLLEKAQSLDLPVDKKNIKVTKPPGEKIRMEVSYSVDVEFPGYTYVWSRHHQIESAIFWF